MGFQTVRGLGAALRDAREDAGLTQAQLADQAGVSRRWLSTVELGSRQGIEVGGVLKVLTALGLELMIRPVSVPAQEGAETGHLRSLGLL